MPENLRVMFEHALPFMVAAANGKGPQLNTPRILEAVIIAAIVGFGTVLGAWLFIVPELKLEFKYMQRDIHSISTEVKTIRTDVNQLKLDAAVEKARHSKD